MTIGADVESEIPEDESGAQRDGIVLQQLKLVKALAAEIYRRLPIAVDLNDLFQAGVVGLLDAVETYDRSKNIAFDSYARSFIKGTIFDSLRHLDFAGNAGIQARAAIPVRHRARTTSALAPHHGSPAGTPDVAADPESQPDRICERNELRRTLARAMERLPRSYRKVLILHYDENLTMKHIGGLLGVSAGRISQIRIKALHKMSKQLQSSGFFPAQMPHQMVRPYVTRGCTDWRGATHPTPQLDLQDEPDQDTRRRRPWLRHLDGYGPQELLTATHPVRSDLQQLSGG